MAIFQRLTPMQGLSFSRLGESPARSRMRLVLAVLVVLNAILLFLVFRPPGRSLSERQEQLKRSKERYDVTLARVAQMRELRAKLGSAIQNDNEFTKVHFLSRNTAFSAMVSDLERLASANQVKTSSINYQLKTDPAQPGFVNVTVAMSVEGVYPELMRFINKLEQSELFWIIENVNVSASPSRGLRLNLLMQTYAVS
ncbi:MAG: type 4a pilus biogenesis protein PilO [Acidobacteria bacterium]|nr:type 4a pilus biogenesis protein PilO [Acidobacteriota bacterium]